MSNWVRISNEELEKSKEIIGLKKGELQIELVKALVKIDKAIERLENIDPCDMHDYIYETGNVLEILKGDNNE